MPDISNYGTEEEWMGACVPKLIDEGKPQEQAVAICMTMWRDKDKRAARGPMEYKSFTQQVKEVNGRTVTGFAGIYGNVDSGNDRTWQGAFKRTIKNNGNRVRHLWQHDITQPPIAAIRELREVGKADLPSELLEKYPEATGGLMVVREYLDTPRGDEVLKGIVNGAISEMSFGYDPVKYDYEGEAKAGTQIRNLRECRLWDTSDVNWGMNEASRAAKKDPAILLAELLTTIKAAQEIDPSALKMVDSVSFKHSLEELMTILTSDKKANTTQEVVPVSSFTDQELTELKRRWEDLQRSIKLYQYSEAIT